MRMCVTGSSSFVGRELLAQCDRSGIEIVGIDAGPPAHPTCRQIDIRSKDLADAVPSDVDAVVHLAALSRDADCVNNAYECFDVNVMGTLNVMRAAEQRRARQFIFASTEWIYGDLHDAAVKDEESLVDVRNLNSEYALSKLVSEALLRQKYIRGFCDSTILRFGIIYGPRAGNWSAVESLTHAVKAGKDVKVGCLETARRFIHVTDVASGILRSVGLKGLHVINLEGARLISLGEIVETAARLLQHTPTLVVGDAAPSIRNVSGQRAKQLLNWEPSVDLESGLRSLLSFV